MYIFIDWLMGQALVVRGGVECRLTACVSNCRPIVFSNLYSAALRSEPMPRERQDLRRDKDIGRWRIRQKRGLKVEGDSKEPIAGKDLNLAIVVMVLGTKRFRLFSERKGRRD